jgi:hypothetical protein
MAGPYKEARTRAEKCGIEVSGLPAVKDKLPKTKMGGLADKLHEIREARLALQGIVDAIKREEQRIIDHIIESIDADTESGVIGKHYKAIVVREEKPVVEDWNKLYQHIREHDAFDLLNRALNASAVRVRWADNVQIPGVGVYQCKKVSLTKVK